jgi:hypothetical protein
MMLSLLGGDSLWPLVDIVAASIVGTWFYIGVLLAAHLLACRLAGFALQVLTIGPLAIQFQTARPTVTWNHQWRSCLAVLAVVPRVDRGHLPSRLVIYWVAGPILVLLSSIVVLLLTWPAFAEAGTPASLPSLALACAGLTGAATVGAQLLPNPNSLPRRIVQLCRGGPPARRICALFLLDAANWAGRRPRVWGHDLLTQAMGVPDNGPLDLAAISCAYYWALDDGNLELASRYHDQQLALLAVNPKINAPTRAMVTAEAAFFEARYRSNPARARRLLAGLGATRVPEPTNSRAQAAILLDEGRQAEARAATQAGRSALAAWGGLGLTTLYEAGFAQP